MSARNELLFQNHIIDSYQNLGGNARKWASEWQKGVPDLIATTLQHGLHLVEVKHRPDFGRMSINNPLEKKQKEICKEYLSSGANVFGMLVSGEKALGSKLYIFDPLCEKIHPSAPHVQYILGKKFDVVLLIDSFRASSCAATSTVL